MAFSINRNLINFGIPLSLLVCLVFLMKSPLFSGNGIVNLAISIDLLLTVPFAYFLLIRKSDIPKTTVIPVVLLGLLIGSYLLPKENQFYISLFKTWALPVIELSILTFVILKVSYAIKKYKALQASKLDFFTILKSTCAEILPPKLVSPFATEVAVFYYGFIYWKTRTIEENEFTYHKKSGTPALIGALNLIIVIETFTFHLLLAQWKEIVAWFFTALSLYSFLQIFGFARSLSKRPISVNTDNLVLNYGILNETKIPFSDIDFIEISRKKLKKDPLARKLSPLGELESHNVILHLKKENEMVGLYGFKKKFKIIGLHIDEPGQFKEKIENALQNRA
ncbi:hypothetical protein [Flexithrix dorotheae]|uniref:hypothetical protein n=1 Tax=Flexithrix dorotheae TaxID=70993 RepID=UPI000380B881|nr:hypothetical protein [Flexithrix dorotheae]